MRENQVGLFLWGEISGGVSAKELSDKLLYEAKVFLTPGFIFGSNGERYMRISLCCNEQNLAEALARVKSVIK